MHLNCSCTALPCLVVAKFIGPIVVLRLINVERKVQFNEKNFLKSTFIFFICSILHECIFANMNISIKVSSVENQQYDKYKPENIIDGDMNTRWSSDYSDTQWVEFDFGKETNLVGMIIYWEAAYAKEYEIYVSKDGTNWKLVYENSGCEGGEDDINFDKISQARFLKLLGKKRATGWGYSIYEVIFKTDKEPFGIGKKVPNVIVYKKFSGEKNVFIPKSWQGNLVAWISDVNNDCSFYFNDKFISDIKKDSVPIIVELKNARSGSWNKFKFISDQQPKPEIKSIVFAENIDKINNEKLKTRSSHEKYYKLLVELYPDKYFPKWLNKKQEFWTIVGNTTGFDEILFSETGIIETHKFGFCIIPYLHKNDKIITYKDAKISISLEENYLPLPEVKWVYNDIEFIQKPFWPENEEVCYVWYKLKNLSNESKNIKLILTIRPIQLNPKWQNAGYTKINSISKSESGNEFIVNNEKIIKLYDKPDNSLILSSQEGDIIEFISKGKFNNNAKDSVRDNSGLASAGIVYNINLDSNEQKDCFFSISNQEIEPLTSDELYNKYQQTKNFWQKVLNKIEFKISDPKIFDVFRTYIAYTLISRDGPALEPGTRNYGLCWARDCATINSAMLKTRNFDVAKEYLEFITKAIPKNGEVPCIIEPKTGKISDFAKSWKEYDGQGAYLFTVAEYYRFTKDKKLVKELFPVLEKVFNYTEKLRARMMTEKQKGTAEYGLLPKSASHEGYLGNWQQSHWDNFWALKGYKDLYELAIAIGKRKFAKQVKEKEEEYRKCLLDSIKLVQQEKDIKYIPASVGLGDFDPTSTAIAVYPTGEYLYLDKESLDYTFNKYYEETVSPRFEQGLQSAYTPYEIRNINAFLLRGEKDKAIKMLYLFMNDLRPKEWHHWAEVVYPEYDTPTYIGDMPHCWVGTEFLNAVRNLFVYEENEQLILCSGIDEKWLDEEVYVKNFPTYYGDINYNIVKTDGKIRIKVEGKAKPENGFVLKLPIPSEKIKEVYVNKKLFTIKNNEVLFKKLPVEIIIIM